MKFINIPDINLKKAINEELSKFIGKRENIQDITEDEIDWYINNEENLFERCGYTILGKGIVFIDKVIGDYNTIFGISASGLIRHLNELGYSINDLM